jgi:transcriptional regulator with XRE-family HTH domain
MDQQPPRQPLRSGGFLWGPERVASGISIDQLAKEAGINVGFLSRMENGVMIPRAEEYQRVHSALKRLQAASIESSATAGE